jgi:hypothetical protein
MPAGDAGASRALSIAATAGVLRIADTLLTP